MPYPFLCSLYIVCLEGDGSKIRIVDQMTAEHVNPPLFSPDLNGQPLKIHVLLWPSCFQLWKHTLHINTLFVVHMLFEINIKNGMMMYHAPKITVWKVFLFHYKYSHMAVANRHSSHLQRSAKSLEYEIGYLGSYPSRGVGTLPTRKDSGNTQRYWVRGKHISPQNALGYFTIRVGCLKALSMCQKTKRLCCLATPKL